MAKEINRSKFLKDFSLITTGTFLTGTATLTSCQVQEKAGKGKKVTGGRVYEIAPEDPRAYVNQSRPQALDPIEKTVRTDREP